ncbi:MAG: hypothetical protein VX112_04610 [Pseudomonadota bacterium]|nr:hypothetical protein [Pseudomonadota bacterium]
MVKNRNSPNKTPKDKKPIASKVERYLQAAKLRKNPDDAYLEEARKVIATRKKANHEVTHQQVAKKLPLSTGVDVNHLISKFNHSGSQNLDEAFFEDASTIGKQDDSTYDSESSLNNLLGDSSLLTRRATNPYDDHSIYPENQRVIIGGPDISNIMPISDDTTDNDSAHSVSQISLESLPSSGSLGEEDVVHDLGDTELEDDISFESSSASEWSNELRHREPRVHSSNLDYTDVTYSFIRLCDDGSQKYDRNIQKKYIRPSSTHSGTDTKPQDTSYYAMEVCWLDSDPAQVAIQAMQNYIKMMGGIDNICQYYTCRPEDLGKGNLPPIQGASDQFRNEAYQYISSISQIYLKDQSKKSSKTARLTNQFKDKTSTIGSRKLHSDEYTGLDDIDISVSSRTTSASSQVSRKSKY